MNKNITLHKEAIPHFQKLSKPHLTQTIKNKTHDSSKTHHPWGLSRTPCVYAKHASFASRKLLGRDFFGRFLVENWSTHLSRKYFVDLGFFFASENIFRTDFCLSDTPNTSTWDSGVARHPKPHSHRDIDVEKPWKSWIFRFLYIFFGKPNKKDLTWPESVSWQQGGGYS